MQEATFQIEDLLSKNASTLNRDIGCTSLTLDVTFKTSCNHCRSRGYSFCSCGFNYHQPHSKKDMEIKATIKNKCNLKMDLEKALFNEELSDFTFIIDDERIPVSKFILSARSPVFYKQFNSEFREKHKTEQILDATFSKEAFKELIRYIYIDDIRELSKYAFELLDASDYYQIESLKSICEDELLNILVEDNANKIFQCAHLYRCSDKLKEAAFNLIKSIFSAKNYTLADSFRDNPSKVSKLLEIKDLLENELVQPTIPENTNVFRELQHEYQLYFS